jgi:mannitol-specific phosphotransferase system IIBC component
MNFYKIVLPVSMVVILITLPEQKADAQLIVTQVVKAVISKVIRAIDLGVQRAQNKTIWLQNAQKVVENQLNQMKLSQIAGINQQQTDLFTKYYNELYTVKAAITDYEHVRSITLTQEALVREYESAWSLTQRDKHFSASELQYISSVYTGILKASINNLDQLLAVVNSFKTQMTDGKRMELINNTSKHIDANYYDLKEFNNQNVMFSLQRAKDESDIQSTKNLYGIQ